MVRNISVIVLVVALLGIAGFQFFADKKEQAALPAEQAPVVDFIAPEFSLGGLNDDQTYTVAGPRDKMLLINFWASWCGPCHEEAPDLNELYAEYSDRLDIYAINVTEYDTLADAVKFVEQYDFEFPVLMDEDHKVTPLYKVRGYPTNFLVDTNGVIIEHYERMLREPELKSIQKHLKKM